MKRYRLSLALLSLLILTSIVGIFSINGLNQSTDLNYIFDNNSILDTENPEYYNQTYLEEYVNFNVRNATELSENYTATYSFENEIEGTSGTDIDYVDVSVGDGSVVILNEFDGHEKVINLSVNTDAQYIYSQSYTGKTSGSIETWVQFDNMDSSIEIALREVGTIVCHVRFTGSNIFVNNLSTQVDVGDCSIDTWYHVRITWRANNTYDTYINGILLADNFLTENNMSGGITREFMRNYNDGYNLYIDAIGYSWDSFYDVGDNMIPITTIENSRKEMDKFEFALEAVNDAYDVGDDDPSGWTDFEQVGGDQVNIGSYPADIDKKISVICDSATDIRGTSRDFSVSGEFVNISILHEYSVLTGTGGTNFYIDSSDDTLIVSLRMLITGEVEYDEDGLGSWVEIFDSLTISEEYTFNFMISYEMEACIFDWYLDGVFQDRYIFPLIATGKEGLGTVQMTHSLVTNDDVNFEIDYIGVYVNGISLADTEFCYLTLDVGLNWSFQENNLFWINASGYFGIYAVDYEIGTYAVPHVAGMGQPLELVKAFRTYDDTDTLFNKYFDTMTEYPTGINNTFLVFYLSEGNISLTSLSIDGVILTEGSNEYPLEFAISSASGVFWVQNNVLYWEIIYNDVGLEYMSATFNIGNVKCVNRSLRFVGQSEQFGYLRLNYTDTTGTSIPLPISTNSFNTIIPQAKTIDSFIVLVTDDDKLVSGFHSGHVSNIRLIWNPSISITIVTISLIMIVIPLIIMIVPTLTIYSKYGKSVIMPVFILMCIICFAGGLIPAWLFFILMIGSGAFLVLRKGSDV